MVIDRSAPRTVYLDVSVNGWPLRMVARFRDEMGRLSLPAEQFAGLGFLLDEAWVTHDGEDRRVYLDQAPDLVWRLDEQAQAIDITAPFDRLAPTRLAAAPGPERVTAQSGRGMLVSYDLFGEWAADPDAGSYGRSLSSALEARLFSSRFTLVTTGSVGWSGGMTRNIRYDTYLAFDDAEKARTVQVGDSVTRGLVWSRNLRFGGLQYTRNYNLRPDIVTTPLADFRGGVTTPSVLDLYVNGVKRYSNGLQPGAFVLDRLPTLTGANEVSIVVTDIDGRERTVTMPLYLSSRMLGDGITDFSFEAGAVREEFGVSSADYGKRFASATWRRGVTNNLTLEAHGEAAKDFWMGGVSGAVAVGALFSIGGSVAASDGPETSGSLWSVSFDRTSQRLSLSARHEQASSGFQDVADLIDEPHPRSRDAVAVGLNMGRGGALNLGYVSEVLGDGTRAPVATASYGVDLFRRNGRLLATAYNVLNDERQWGVGVTLSVTLGQRGMVSGGVQYRDEARHYEAEARGSAMDDRLHWQVRDTEGTVPARSAELRWDGVKFDGRVRLLNDPSTSAMQIEASQSFVLFDRHLFVADRVDEAFAVVQVGRSRGVEVFHENQPVGQTDDDGRLFVNHLRAYEANSLAVDPAALPLNAALETVAKTASPRRGGGVAVTFGVVEERSALVTLITPDGGNPPPGAEAHLGDRVFPVGYGGEVYLRGVEAGRNLLRVLWRGRQCEVFIVAPNKLDGIPKLGPYTCKP
jgi:outer membrane usher protein